MVLESKFEQFSYLSSKWVVKQQRQFATSTMHLAQELLTNVQCSSGSKSFAKEMRALKMRRAGAGHQKLTTTNWKDHRSWSFYSYMRSCWRTQCQPFSGHSAFEANWKDESWISGCLTSWPQIKKIVVLKCHLLLLYPTTVNHFMIRLWCDKKWILYDNWWWPAQWLDWEEAPKHFPKPNLHHKKVLVTVWWSAAIWSTTAFWILVKPLYLRSMLSNSMRCTENCNAYSWH